MPADGSFQCSVAASKRAEPLFATASNVRRWLLVEVRGAWGADVVADTALGRHVGPEWQAALAGASIRPLAIRRGPGDIHGTSSCAYLVDSSRGPHSPGVVRRCELPDLAAVVDIALLGPGVSSGDGWEPVDERLLLVCTNGKHDPCCATFGRPLARHLRSGSWAGAVWECTHIGGDRFAANLLVLPDALYFGRVTPDAVDAMLGKLVAGELDLDHFRGRSSLTFVEQAAEHFVRRELGLDSVGAVVSVRRRRDHPDASRRVAVVDVDLHDGTTFEVELERSAQPAPDPLTCSGSAGVSQPVHRLVDLRELGTGPAG